MRTWKAFFFNFLFREVKICFFSWPNVWLINWLTEETPKSPKHRNTYPHYLQSVTLRSKMNNTKIQHALVTFKALWEVSKNYFFPAISNKLNYFHSIEMLSKNWNLFNIFLPHLQLALKKFVPIVLNFHGTTFRFSFQSIRSSKIILFSACFVLWTVLETQAFLIRIIWSFTKQNKSTS